MEIFFLLILLILFFVIFLFFWFFFLILVLFCFIALLMIIFVVFLVGFLILIFSQSLPLAERITSEKWPLYKEYQKQVPSLFPIGRGVDWKNKVQ